MALRVIASRQPIHGRGTVLMMGSRGDSEPDSEFELVNGAMDLAIDLCVYRLSAIKKAACHLRDRHDTR